jgi:hypothetical protein
MVLDELLSFRTHFWPSHFPIEARYYEYKATGPSLTLKARCIAGQLRYIRYVRESCVVRITIGDALLPVALRLSRSGGVNRSRVPAGYRAGTWLQ